MISEETKQRIEQEAKEWEKSYYTHLTQHSHKGPSFHFIAGATAEAEKAQRLADALEQILEMAKFMGGNMTLYDSRLFESFSNSYMNVTYNAETALQQWRGEK